MVTVAPKMAVSVSEEPSKVLVRFALVTSPPTITTSNVMDVSPATVLSATFITSNWSLDAPVSPASVAIKLLASKLTESISYDPWIRVVVSNE